MRRIFSEGSSEAPPNSVMKEELRVKNMEDLIKKLLIVADMLAIVP